MRALLSTAGGTFAALLPITNPVGGAAVFATLTAGDDAATRARQARLTSVYVLGILAVFLLAGRPILEFFGISVGVLKIAGGLIVGHAAWAMVTGSGGSRRPSTRRDWARPTSRSAPWRCPSSPGRARSAS